LVFPEAWAKLNGVIHADGAYLITGGYIPRDQGEEQAPFIVERASALDDLRPSGAIGVALRWTAASRPQPETTRAIAALCAAHPGPTPARTDWGGGRGENGNKERDENGSTVRLRSRTFRVDAADDLLAALRDLLGTDGVTLVKA
jgi:hypothetical protein